MPSRPTAKGTRVTEDFVMKAVEVLRENPKKYAAVRKSLSKAKTDRARAKSLLKFATSDRELAALVPSGSGTTQLATVTTVTVTTIFILEDSAY
jgi:hypothetical protein